MKNTNKIQKPKRASKKLYESSFQELLKNIEILQKQIQKFNIYEAVA